MLIKDSLQYSVHVFNYINRNHLVNYIDQIFIDGDRLVLVRKQRGWVTFLFIVYILTDYQITIYAIRNLDLYIMQYLFYILRYYFQR